MKSKSNTGGIVFVIVVVLLILAVVGGSRSGTKGKSDVCVMCREFVEKQLKAPSTADHQSCNEATLIEVSENHWVFSAYVDAQNSFGAQVRTNYICEIKYAGEGNWQLVGLTTP